MTRTKKTSLEAAAADLLKSLQDLLPFAEKEISRTNSEMIGSWYPYLNICKIKDAKEAIAKATGEKL